jgi:hypothetical protein
MPQHCWLRFRKHQWKLTERKVRSDLITEIEECVVCQWQRISFSYLWY